MAAHIDLLFTGLAASADKFLFGTSTVAVVRAARELIVFDTGPYAYRPILQGRLRRAGIDPSEVTKVVLSHLHWDNAANADLFGTADVLVHRRELEAADRATERDWAIPNTRLARCGGCGLRPSAARSSWRPICGSSSFPATRRDRWDCWSAAAFWRAMPSAAPGKPRPASSGPAPAANRKRWQASTRRWRWRKSSIPATTGRSASARPSNTCRTTS
jgi:hypothetical protein